MSDRNRTRDVDTTVSDRKLKARKKRKKRRIILVLEILILLILAAVLYVYSKFGKIDFTNIGPIKTNNLDEKTEDMLHGYTTFALFGVDNRNMNVYDSGESDTIIVCVIDNKSKEVNLMSVYRDTCLDATGNQEFKKCNYAYNHGGPEKAIEMLNRNLDLEIQDYVSANWKALADAIDVVGGIEADITKAESYALDGDGRMVLQLTGEAIGREAKHVEPGHQTLDGVQAVAYCRIRHAVGDDFARAGRQRYVLSQLIEKTKAGGIGTANKVIDAVFPEISTSLSMGQMIGLASHAVDYKLKDTTGFPYLKKTANINRSSMVVPCTLEENVKLMYENLYAEKDYEPSETVKGLSALIQKKTGLGVEDALDYGDATYTGETGQ